MTQGRLTTFKTFQSLKPFNRCARFLAGTVVSNGSKRFTASLRSGLTRLLVKVQKFKVSMESEKAKRGLHQGNWRGISDL
jgi:hypothetical protein